MGNILEKKKKFIAASVATAVVASAMPTAPVFADGKSFTDISPNFFAYEEIIGLAKAGVINGYGDGTFRPYETITRGQTAIMLAQALDLPAAAKAKKLKDINEKSPYYDAVSAVMQAGIILGYGDEFKPNETLTREEMATIMVRAFHLTEKSQVEVPFTDLLTISPTHRKNVEILYQNGLTKGIDGKTYAPKESVTRVQFAMFLYRQLKGSLPVDPVVTPPTTDPSPGSGETVLPTETIQKNMFESLHEYNKNYIINPVETAVFGGDITGNHAVVQGNITVKGTLELKNLTIKGTLFLDPGDEGEVTLTNVDAGKIEVLSGETGTIQFSGVNAPQVIVKDQNGIKLETDGSSTLGSLELSPGNGSEVQLAGNFNDTNILITKGTTLTAKNNFMASAIEIKVASPDSEVSLQADTPTDLPPITVSSGVKLTSLSENISTPLIQVNVQQPNQTVELNGPLGKPEVIVEKPITLSVKTPLSKVTANANVSLEGSEATNIESLEAGQNSTITSSNEQIQTALNAKKTESITLAKAKIEVLKDEAQPSLQAIKEADALVKTALSLGAVKADFQSGNVNLYDVLEAIKTAAADKLASITAFEQKLAALPKPEKLGSYTTFSISRLEKSVAAAKAAEQAVIAAGGDEKTAANYERLAAAEARVIELKTEYQQAKSEAITALQALPAADSIKAENLESAKEALEAANEAVALAKKKGVRDWEYTINNINLLTKLAEVANAITKVEAEYEAAKKAAIEYAISKVALIPAKAEITVQNLEHVRNTVQVARAAVDAALKIGVEHAEITNLYLLTDAEAKIASLDEARTTAIAAANSAISMLPEPESITITNLSDAKNKLETAEKAVADAKSSGAVDADFTGLEKIAAVKEKISALETAKQTAITEAVAALDEIPAAAEITAANFKSVKEQVTAAKAKVAKAKELGAVDSDLPGLEKIAAAEAKIAELEEVLSTAVTAANNAIAQLPEVAAITMANIDDAKAKLQAAETAVAEAREKGAADSDFTGLEKITAVKDRIASLEKGKQAAIQDAVEALSHVPAVIDITAANFKSVKTKVVFAREKVDVAKELGAKDSDLTGLEKLEPAEAKIASLEEALADAITAANQKLSEIPAANEITLDNIEEVRQKIAAAKAAVEAAKQSGASDDDFTGLDKIAEAEAKVAQLEADKAAAIKAANDAIAEVPAADSITIENYKDAEAKITTAEAAIKAARDKGAVDADFTGLSTIAEAKAKIADLLKALADAVEAANTALAAIPAADSITIQNYKTVEDKVKAAEEAVADARAKGAVDADFTGLEKIADAKSKIAAILKALADAIAAANTALAAIPEPASITFANHKDVETKIGAAEAAVEAAREKGATDDDFNGLERIEAAQVKIAALLKELSDAIAAADAALAEIPAADSITFENVQAAEANITAAENAVAAARAKGAVDTDFTGLDKMAEAKAKVEALKKELADAITAANIALAEIPAADTITIGNYQEAEAKIEAAEAVVEAARSKGATDADFTGLSKIQEAKTKIAALLKVLNDAITAANQAIEALPDPSSITAINIDDAIAKVDAAKKAVAAAKAKGAVDTDFVNLDKIAAVEAKIQEFGDQKAAAIKAANDALAVVPAAEAITADNAAEARAKVQRAQLLVAEAKAKGAVDTDFVGLDKLDAAIEKLKEFESQYDLPNWKSPLESLKRINENINNFTQDDFENVRGMTYVRGQYEQYRKALIEAKASKGKDLTLGDIKEIISNLNLEFEKEALQLLNENPTAVTVDDLEKIMPWITPDNFSLDLNNVIDRVQALISEKGSVSYSDLGEVIESLQVEKAMLDMEQHKENMTWDSLVHIIASYEVYPEGFLFGTYKERMKQHVDGNGILTPEVIMQIVKQTNIAAYNSALDTMKNNPSALSQDDFYILGLHVDESLLNYYRAALAKKKEEMSGEMTLFIAEEVINLVNREAYMDDINAGGEYLYSIVNLTGYIFDFTMLAEYHAAVEEALSKGPITYQELIELVKTVNSEKEKSILTLVNENPHEVTIFQLRALEIGEYLEQAFLGQYRIAIEAAINQKGAPLTKAEISNVIYKVNAEEALIALNIDPESVSIYLIRYLRDNQMHELLLDRYLAGLRAELDANRQITKQTLNDIFDQVNTAAKEEYFKLIIENPAELNLDTFLIAFPSIGFNSDLMEDYRKAILDLKQAATEPLTRVEVEQVIEGLTEAYRQEIEQSVLNQLNENPESLTWPQLRQLSFIYMEEELFEQYKMKFLSLHDQGMIFTYENLENVIEEVHFAYALSKINGNPDKITINDLHLISYEARSAYLEYYIAAIKNAELPLTAEGVISLIQDVNHDVALQKVGTSPMTLSISDLQLLYGHIARYENYDAYIAEIELAIEAGVTLTEASLRDIIEMVNNRVIEEALKDINDNPMSFAFKSLETVVRYYLYVDYLDYYREAINAERANGQLSVEQLNMIVQQVHDQMEELKKQQALEFILANPDTFTERDLEAAGFWYAADQYGQYIDRFRAAIKAKVEEAGTNIPRQEIEQLIEEVIREIQDGIQTEVLNKINNDLENVTFADLENLTSDLAREQYFDQYISALELLLADGPVHDYQVYEVMREVNKQGSLAAINSGSQLSYQLLSDVFVSADFYSYYDEYLTYYHEAFAKEIAANGDLTVAELIEVIKTVNAEKGLAHIIANPDNFTHQSLSAVMGTDFYGEYFENFRKLISEFIALNGTITAEKVRDLVSEETERILLEKIQQNPMAAEAYDIKYLLDDKDWDIVRQQDINRYRQAIAEFVAGMAEGEQLTAENLSTIVAAVNVILDQERLDVINKNLTGFQTWNLYEVFNYFDIEMDIWADIEFYRTAVQEMHAVQGDLSISDLVEAVNIANAAAEQALVDAINNNIAGFDYYELSELVNHFADNIRVRWEFLEFYRTAIQEKYDQEPRPLTVEEILQAVEQGNTVGEQSLLDAINLNPDGFTDFNLQQLFSYFNIDVQVDWENVDYYRTAVKEMQEKLKRSDLTLEEIIEAVEIGNAAAEQADLDRINKNLQGFEFWELQQVLVYELLDQEGIQLDYQDLETYRAAIIKKYDDLGRDLTAEEITEAVIQGYFNVIQDTLDFINQDGSQFSIDHLEKVLGYIDEIKSDNLVHYRKAVADLRNELGHDLSPEELLEAVKRGNEYAAGDYLYRINNDPDSISHSELQLFAGDSVKVLLLRLDLYMDRIQTQKQALGHDLSKEEVLAVIEAANQEIAADFVDQVNNNPETIDEDDLDDLSLVYENWNYQRLRLYQIAFMNHRANGGPALTLEGIAQMVEEIDNSGEYLYAFIDPLRTYQVGDLVDVEIPYGMIVYLVPKSADSNMTPTQMEDLVANGLGLKLYPENYTNFVRFDTAELQAGDYVAYVINSNGSMSTASNTLTLNEAAQQPQEPEQPADPEQPEPPGATVANMEISYTSGKYVKVTVTDGDQNLDVEAVDTIEVFVESQHDYITITLTETSEDSGVFAGTFSFGDVDDDEKDIIYAEPSQIVTASYIDNGDEENPVFKEVTYQP